MNKQPLNGPPPDAIFGTDLPVTHNIIEVYRLFQTTSNRLPKSIKLGMHAVIERELLTCIRLLISATFLQKEYKLPILIEARVSLSVVSHLIRLSYQTKIIKKESYLFLFPKIIETGKMISTWITSLQQNPA